MSPNAAPIKLRDGSTILQQKLGLSNQKFANFKDLARKTHIEYRSSYPDSKWADERVVWQALPEEELTTITEIMYDLCQRRMIFQPGESKERIVHGASVRLYQVRRSWQQHIRDSWKRHQRSLGFPTDE